MRKQHEPEQSVKRETGLPGGGAGRKDYIRKSGVYPFSGPSPKGDAPTVLAGSWGQGERGAAGYADHGESGMMGLPCVPEKCRDIMTKDPVFCQAADSVAIAAKLMERHSIGALPVVGSLRGRKLVGIVTDRDLAVRVVAADRHPAKTTVHDVMSANVITCSPDDPYDKAIELMEQHQIRRIPAVDDRGCVVGMISEADVALRIPDSTKIEDVVRSIVRPN